MFEQTMSLELRNELRATTELVGQRDDALAVPQESGEFLHTLALAGGFRRGLEIGTSYGYSGLWIGSALRHNGGTLTTIDVSAKKTEHAQGVFARAGLDDTITCLNGEAAAVLDTLHGPFDFVFIDADKENSLRYFELIWPKLAHHATIVTDNATSHATELATYLHHLRQHPGLTSTLVGIGSGLELSVKVEAYHTATLDGADWVI